MKLITISLTDRCVRRCTYCPLGKYRDGFGDIDINALLAWLFAYWEEDWILEYSGGEPSIHPGFELLRDWSSLHNARVIIRTCVPTIDARPNEKVLIGIHGRKISKSDNPNVLRLGFFADEEMEVAERFQGKWPPGHNKLAEEHIAPDCGNLRSLFIVPSGHIHRCAKEQEDLGTIHEMTDPNLLLKPLRCTGCPGCNMAYKLFVGEPHNAGWHDRLVEMRNKLLNVSR